MAHWSSTRTCKRLFKGHGQSHAPCRQTTHFIQPRNSGHWKRQWSPIQVYSCKIDLLHLWCDAHSNSKPRGNFENELNQISLHTSPEKGVGPGPPCAWMYVSAYQWRGNILQTVAVFVWVFHQFHECSSWFTRCSQIPILGRQLGLFGGNCVFRVFGVGPVAARGTMQDLEGGHRLTLAPHDDSGSILPWAEWLLLLGQCLRQRPVL